MSATNRGATRRPNDFYETPEWCTRALFSVGGSYVTSGFRILEPTAGSGAIVRVTKDILYNADLTAVEIDGNHFDNLVNAGADDVHIGNILEKRAEDLGGTFNMIVGNPPYKYAQEVIEHCWLYMMQPHSVMHMLLRLNFLGSRKRYNFWDEYPLYKLNVLSKRPSFTNGGTDATDYAWFTWYRPMAGKAIRSGISNHIRFSIPEEQ